MWRLYGSLHNEWFTFLLVTPLFAFELYDGSLDFISDRFRTGFAIWWQWNDAWRPGSYRFTRRFERVRYDTENSANGFAPRRPNFS